MEFVAKQLRRVNWISGYTYLESTGYRLDWSSQGAHRMQLLQIALKNKWTDIHSLDQLRSDDPECHRAIMDFWGACLAQLSLSGENDEISSFVKIIESWKSQS